MASYCAIDLLAIVVHFNLKQYFLIFTLKMHREVTVVKDGSVWHLSVNVINNHSMSLISNYFTTLQVYNTNFKGLLTIFKDFMGELLNYMIRNLR